MNFIVLFIIFPLVFALLCGVIALLAVYIKK